MTLFCICIILTEILLKYATNAHTEFMQEILLIQTFIFKEMGAAVLEKKTPQSALWHQYLIGYPLFFNTRLIRSGMEATSLLQTSGVTSRHQRRDKAAFSWGISSCVPFCILALMINHKFSIGLISGELPGQASNSISLSANHLMTLRAVWQGALSC